MNITQLLPAVLQEVGTYLPESKDRASAIVASRVFLEPFQQSAEQLLREFSPIFAIPMEQEGCEIPEKKWQRVVAQVDDFLNKYQFFLSEEEKNNLKDLSFIQRGQLQKNVLEKREAMSVRFFEKLARLSPAAKTFFASLPLELSQATMAARMRTWMARNRNLLNQELQQDLSREEREAFREDRITRKFDALFWGLEEFPVELFFVDFPEEVREKVHDALFYILRELPYPTDFYRGTLGSSLQHVLPEIAGRGYLGLVKALLATSIAQRIAAAGRESLFRTSLLGAVRQGRLGVTKAMITTPCFRIAEYFTPCAFQALETAIDHGNAEAIRLLFETLGENLIISRFPNLLIRARLRRQREVEGELVTWGRQIEARRRDRISEMRRKRALKIARHF